ncbi:MAG: rhodanese-like domain-containing protein [Pyrinomonadaceae bacterium]
MRYLILLSALIVTTAFALAGCNQTALSQQTTKNPANSTITQTPQNTPEEAKRISLADAKAAYDAKNVVIVDTRDKDSFAQEHIKGAINIPIAEFENRLKELPADKQIIAYCS